MAIVTIKQYPTGRDDCSVSLVRNGNTFIVEAYFDANGKTVKIKVPIKYEEGVEEDEAVSQAMEKADACGNDVAMKIKSGEVKRAQDLQGYTFNQQQMLQEKKNMKIKESQLRNMIAEAIEEFYKGSQKEKAAYENACDCLYYGYGFNFWLERNSALLNSDVELAKKIWQQAKLDMSSED